jgi:hypothetical protein
MKGGGREEKKECERETEKQVSKIRGWQGRRKPSFD